FGPGRNVFFALKQLNLHPHFVPNGLLRVTLDSGARSAVAWLHRIFKVNHTELRMVAAVHGVEIKRGQTLSNGVCLMPLSEAPDSHNLRSLARGYRCIHRA